MEYINKIANLQDYVLNNITQYYEMVIYTLVAFLLPIFLGHQQLIVGTVVNAMLITAALNLKGIKLLPVIIAPSLGAAVAGFIFGPLTIFLFYLIPFIWIGNSILVFSFKYFQLNKKKNYIITLLIGSILKSGFLFLTTFVLYKLTLIPVIFLTAMGILQLTTAITGGVLAAGIHYTKKRYLA